jgi:hypothetical protein
MPGVEPSAPGFVDQFRGLAKVVRRARLQEGYAVRRIAWLPIWVALLAAAGCVGDAAVPGGNTVGPSPALPDPTHSVIPTVEVAPAVG